MRPKIDKHDIDTKLRKAREFLAEGDKVQVQMLFRGRELAHIDLGYKRLMEFAQQLDDMSKLEKAPAREGRQMTMMLVPRPNAATVLAKHAAEAKLAKEGKKDKKETEHHEEALPEEDDDLTEESPLNDDELTEESAAEHLEATESAHEGESSDAVAANRAVEARDGESVDLSETQSRERPQ
jgi:hypothetical protein